MRGTSNRLSIGRALRDVYEGEKGLLQLGRWVQEKENYKYVFFLKRTTSGGESKFGGVLPFVQIVRGCGVQIDRCGCHSSCFDLSLIYDSFKPPPARHTWDVPRLALFFARAPSLIERGRHQHLQLETVH